MNHDERRTDPRLSLALAVRAETSCGTSAWTTRDLSLGGACLTGPDVDDVEIGERVQLEVPIPGRAPLRTEAEVRWAGGGRIGVRFAPAARRTLAAAFTALVALASGDATATVPTFDPQAPTQIDVQGPGHSGTRPDEFAVEQAFEASFGAIDQCVAGVRQADEQVQGDANVQVLLNPAGSAPLGLNLAVSGPNAEDPALVDCLRDATAAAPFPAYDGPPIVVGLEFELDPGSEIVM